MEAPVVVRSLAEEDAAADLAAEFEGYLHAPELNAPLHAFLGRLRQRALPGFRGVALAAWEAAPEPSYLALYALVDGTGRSAAAARETAAAVLRAHDDLNGELRADRSAVACGLWFVETGGEDLDTFGAKLPALLARPDPFEPPLREGERIVHLRVAKAA